METGQLENAIDRSVTDFEDHIKHLEKNGERTWLCPGCGKVRCLYGELCLFCRGDDNDYREEQALNTQLRYGG